MYINDKKFDYKKTGKASWIEQLIKDAWRDLDEIYNLEKGGNIVMDWAKGIGISVPISNENGKEKGKNMEYPRGVHMSRKMTITDKEGEIYEIILADKRTAKTVGDEVEYTYLPSKNIKFSTIKMLTKKDKDLIIALYLFSNILTTKPEKMDYTINNSRRPFFTFSNPKKKIEEEFDDIEFKYKVTSAVKKMTERQIVAYARRLSIQSPQVMDRKLLNKEIYDISITSKEKANELIDFAKSFTDDYFDVIDTVNAAIEKGIIVADKQTAGNKVMAIFTLKGEEKPFFSTIYQLDKVNRDALSMYLTKKPDLVSVISNKL